jgi:hypothetical protein
MEIAPPKRETRSTWLNICVEPSLKKAIHAYARKHKLTNSTAAHFILSAFLRGDFVLSKEKPRETDVTVSLQEGM